MTLKVTDIDAEGLVVMNPTEHYGLGFSADTARLIAPVLGDLDSRTPVTTLTYNARLEQDLMAVMFGVIEEAPTVTVDFDLYSLGTIEGREDEGDYILFIHKAEEGTYLSKGDLASAEECTADKCPDGGVGYLLVKDEEWEQFVKDFTEAIPLMA